MAANGFLVVFASANLQQTGSPAVAVELLNPVNLDGNQDGKH
jgi:hypothetical protein